MKKKLFILGTCLFMLSGCGSRIPTLKNGQDAVVSFESGKKISVDDLYADVKSSYALNSLLKLIDTTILEDKYKNSLEDATASIDKTITSQMQYYTSNGYTFESVLDFAQNLGFSTEEALRDQVYLSYLQNLAIEDYAKDQISKNDIKEYYDNEISGDVKVSHILIAPAVTDKMTDTEKAEAEAKAQATITKIINELKKTSAKKVDAKFKELVEKYSQDETTKNNGGSLGYINKGTLGDNYTTLEEAAFKLKDGEYSTKVITTTYGYHVVLRVDTKAKASLDDVRSNIIETLSQSLITSDKTVSVKALQKLRKDYGLEIIDDELAKQYATYIQKQLTTIDKSN